MIRTKQITVVCASVALLCILCAQAFATRSASPNYATNSHEDMSLYYYGYVQCQPSYNEDGKHAQAGYIRYWRYDLLGNTVNDTGRLYTPYGTVYSLWHRPDRFSPTDQESHLYGFNYSESA